MEEMKQAIQELRAAENMFENAITEKQIDRAIHLINAAQARIDLISRGDVN